MSAFVPRLMFKAVRVLDLLAAAALLLAFS